MSTLYILPAVVESYGLTIEQWFDPHWNFNDPYQLKYSYHGKCVTLIRGTGNLPQSFEFYGSKGQCKRRMNFKQHWQGLTVDDEDVTRWLNRWGASDKRIAPICNFGHSAYRRFVVGASMNGPRRFLWHIQNRKNELADTNPNESKLTLGDYASAALTTVLRFLR